MQRTAEAWHLERERIDVMAHRSIVVIGGSAGGLEALRRVVRDLPADLEAAVFVVLHSAAESPGLLDSILARHTALRVQYAHDGARNREEDNR